MSTLYNAFMQKLVKGDVDFDTLALKVLLVTSAYTPNRATHEFRSAVTNEVVGTGYTSGGVATTPTVTRDDVNNRINIALSAVSWAASTITARAAVVYIDKGSAATDELVAYSPFPADVSSSASAFAVAFTSPLRLQG